MDNGNGKSEKIKGLEMFRKSFVLVLLFTVSVLGQQTVPPCENPESNAFDWQIGVWQSDGGKQVHEVKKVSDGCVVQEIWRRDGKDYAIALKSFDDGRHNKTGEKKWFYSWTAAGFHQLWEGRKENVQWRFYREWFFNGEKVLSRTYWTQVAADKLERIVEQSRDDGKTWRSHVKNSFIRKNSPTFFIRNAHGLVYDSARGKTILFGGADHEKVLSDTWEFDGEKWSLVLANSPAPRTFPAMAYDSVRKKTLLFGGNRVLFGKDYNDYEFLKDFWEFDGKIWKKIDVSTPDARAEASFIFDEQRKKAVLFGGYRIENGAMKPLSDTWEWDGKSWTKVAEDIPSARSGASIAYDSKRKRAILFGGGIKSGGANETWEWDGKTWREIKSAKSEPRYNSTMVYDKSRNKIVRFGGWDGVQRVSETWEFDGSNWTKLAIESPDARNHTTMVYDRLRKKIILFGGHNGDFIFGDSWEFDGKVWRKIISTEPQRRVNNGH
ncbi:MAG: kelch repeat-containing protein [Acidobacteriota bacterium]